MLQAELKILGGKHQGKLIPLSTKKFLVGREQDCHLRPNSDLVSRHHCVFSIDDYSVRLRDLGSTNGTMVNGNQMRGEVLLKAGDRVTIGKLELEVMIRQTAAKSQTPVPTSSPSLAATPPQALSTAEISTNSDEVDTSYEMAAFTPPPSTIEVPVPMQGSADTAIIGSSDPQMQPPGFGGYPPPNYPQMMPSGYPMPGAYMPPQYPQYPPAYGQMPGYAQPMGYPPMGYPQMMPMQQGYPAAAAVAAPAAAPAEAAEAAPSSSQIPVRLPNPEETGAKPVAPPAPAAPGAAPKKEEKPSTSAADIIKQYMSRRG